MRTAEEIRAEIERLNAAIDDRANSDAQRLGLVHRQEALRWALHGAATASMPSASACVGLDAAVSLATTAELIARVAEIVADNNWGGADMKHAHVLKREAREFARRAREALPHG